MSGPIGQRDSIAQRQRILVRDAVDFLRRPSIRLKDRLEARLTVKRLAGDEITDEALDNLLNGKLTSDEITTLLLP